LGFYKYGVFFVLLVDQQFPRVILQIVGAYVFHGVLFRSCRVVSSYCFLSYILGIAFRNAGSEHVSATVLVPQLWQGRHKVLDESEIVMPKVRGKTTIR